MTSPRPRVYGDCFEASLRSAEELQFVKESVESGTPNAHEVRNIYDRLGLHRTISVVHGTAVPTNGPDAGRTLVHAWMEVGDEVFERSNGQAQRYASSDYYALYSIQAIRRYAPAEARQLAQTHGRYAAWHQLPEPTSTAEGE
jgi:hypothetical protein